MRVGDRLMVVRPTQTVPLTLPEGAHRFWAMAVHEHHLTFGLHDTDGGD
ncbi:MAG: hypothetical protein GWN07_01625, partial [Actinobacteria bacterium]|nr:hypothetical protein [Actinomycetota bacterium]